MKKCIGGVLIVAMVGLLICAPSHADGCHVRQFYNYGYQQQHYQQQYYQPKTVYQYEKVVVPVAVRAIVSPDYYFSVNDYARDKLLADTIGEKIRQNQTQNYTQGKSSCDEKVELLTKQLAELKAKVEGAAPVASPTKPVQTGSSGGPVPAGLAKVVETSCLRCHGAEAGSKGGSFDLRNLEAVGELQRLRSFAHVNVGTMPKAAKALPNEEVQLFFEWATAQKASTK